MEGANIKYLTSVIVPFYNNEQQILICFESIRTQTLGFKNIQIIFANDCSTDNTEILIKQFAGKYENVFVVKSNLNSGFAGAPRNLALNLVQSDCVMFLDADDTFSIDACEILYNALKQNDADMATGYYQIVSSKKEVLSTVPSVYKDLKSFKTKLPEELEKELFVRDSFWCRIYKTKIIRDNKLFFPENVPGEDIFFLYSYILCCKSAIYTAKHVYNYTQNDKSVTQNKKYSYYLKLFDCYKLMHAMFVNKGFAYAFDIVTNGVLNEHLSNALNNREINQDDAEKLLTHTKWFLEYEKAIGRIEEFAFLKSLNEHIDNFGAHQTSKVIKMFLDIAVIEKKKNIAEQQVNSLAHTLNEIKNSRKWKLIHLFDRK